MSASASYYWHLATLPILQFNGEHILIGNVLLCVTEQRVLRPSGGVSVDAVGFVRTGLQRGRDPWHLLVGNEVQLPAVRARGDGHVHLQQPGQVSVSREQGLLRSY